MRLLLSSLWGAAGGIPAFNRLLVRSAARFCAERGLALEVVAQTDGPQAMPAEWEHSLRSCGVGSALSPGWYKPCAGRRSELVRHALHRRGEHEGLLCGHVHLAPLGVGAARFGVIAHGTEVWTELSLLRRLALRRAAAIGGVSEHTLAAVERVQGVRRERLVRIINALDEATAERAARARCEGATPVAADAPLQILSVTRLHPGEPKGIDLVIDALATLPGMRYTVVGTGEARTALEERARRAGVAERVRFLGALDDESRDRELRRCDVFALPSSGEGFGIAYLEAMAYGKPCLCARVGGAPEVVLDGTTGLAVPPTVPAVRDALLRLADPALRRRMGEAGVRRVSEHFTFEHFDRFARDLFARLLG